MSLSPALTDLLRLIRSVEAAGGGYNADYALDDHWDLVSMTFDQAMAKGREQVTSGGKAGGRERSSAIGGYQFLTSTMVGLKKNLNIAGPELFDEYLQDRMAVELMNGRGLTSYLAGKMTASAFANNLAKEWASLPVVTAIKGAHRQLTPGQSYYAGDGLNKSLVTVPDFVAAVSALKAPAPVEVHQPATDALPWMDIAKQEIGVKETLGAGNNPRIVEYHKEVSGVAHPDATAWCAAYVGFCLEEAGLPSTNALNARSYLGYGQKVVGAPQYGDIAVFWRVSRNSWQGHVAFVLEEYATTVECLGGNQSDQVCKQKYPKDQLLGYVRPIYTPPAHEADPDDPTATAPVGFLKGIAAAFSLYGASK